MFQPISIFILNQHFIKIQKGKKREEEKTLKFKNQTIDILFGKVEMKLEKTEAQNIFRAFLVSFPRKNITN